MATVLLTVAGLVGLLLLALVLLPRLLPWLLERMPGVEVRTLDMASGPSLHLEEECPGRWELVGERDQRWVGVVYGEGVTYRCTHCGAEPEPTAHNLARISMETRMAAQLHQATQEGQGLLLEEGDEL